MTRGSRKKQKTSDQVCNEEDDDLSLLSTPSTSKSQVLESPDNLGDKRDDNHNYSSTLLSLPHLVLLNIVDNLPVSDVCTISRVNKFLYDFIKSNYITVAKLSGPSASSTSPGPSQDTSSPSINILSLIMTLSVSQLPTGDSNYSYQNTK